LTTSRRIYTQTVASGEVSTFGYDNRNRETSVSHATSTGTVLESESYIYDPAGNLSSKTVGSWTVYCVLWRKSVRSKALRS
jgi:YD repeat-containing protein